MKQQLAVNPNRKEVTVMGSQPPEGTGVPSRTPMMSSFESRVRPARAGLVLGALFGGWHFLWAILVAAGWAQPVMDFVFWMHFLHPPWTVGSFHAGVAIVLVAVTSAMGYAFGYVMGVLWNWIRG
jgi:hypothetical protein